MAIKEDLTGMEFGRLKVLGIEKGEWVCKCVCGKTVKYNRSSLVKSEKKKYTVNSCGCFKRSKSINKIDRFIGNRFGKWILLKYAFKENTHVFVEVMCDCGCVKNVSFHSLKSGTSKGCYKCCNKLDVEGNRYGRMVIIERSGADVHGSSLYKCRCDCGNYKVVYLSSLRTGATKSCGCYRKECLSSRNKGLLVESVLL